MRIALINTSPKHRDSNGAFYLAQITQRILPPHEAYTVNLRGDTIPQEKREQLLLSDVWLITAGLYVDCFPSHVISLLEELALLARERSAPVRLAGLINCGFYEGEQGRHCLHVLQNWAAANAAVWVGGLSIGAAPALPAMINNRLYRLLGVTRRAKKPVLEQLDRLTAGMTAGAETTALAFVSVGIPRSAYFLSTRALWRRMIRQSGGKKKDLDLQLP